ncbi:hypothetical protein [Streptodolium elevatio]
MDLDDYFSFGTGGPFNRNEIFANREDFLDLLMRHTENHAAQRWSAAEFTDFQRAAHNVVVLHGDGGIGKSTLTQRFATTLTTADRRVLPERRVVACVDFADITNLGFETVLLRLRASVGRLGRRFPAFDTALAVYWELKHPGVALGDFIGRSTFLDSNDRENAGGQIVATLDDVLGSAGAVGAGYRMVSGLARRISEAAVVRRLRHEFPPFEVILQENDPDRMVGYLPILLAWDIEHIRRAHGAVAVCVLDTFETVQAQPREAGFLEDLVARTVYLMPNVLFLVAGRRPLRWHDPVRAVTLTYGGELRWPRLAGRHGAGDQHALPGLPSDHADLFLRTRLTAADGTPAIDEAIRRRISEASGGSPLYLELSVGQYRNAVARGEQPTADQFGGPLPDLVLRIMRDLTADERDLLRAASLLGAFDADSLAAILPGTGGAAIERFLSMSFVRRSEATWPSCRLHENLRNSVNTCDMYTDDGWTDSERSRRFELATGHVTGIGLQVWNADAADSVTATQRSQAAVAALLLVVQAAVERRVTPRRLDALTYTASQLGHWQVLAALPSADGCPPPLQRLVEAARLGATAGVDARHRYQSMRALASPVREHPYDDYVSYELGALTQSTGNNDEGAQHFGALATAESPLREAGVWGSAGVALRRSRLADVLGLVREDPDQPLEVARTQDLLGHVRLHGGDFAVSADLFERTLAHARASGAPLWAARAARHLALATMWTEPHRALALLPDARDLNQSLGDVIGSAQCDLAAALASVALGDDAEALRMLAHAAQLTMESGVVGQLLPVDAVGTLVHLAGGRRDEARAAAARLAADAHGERLAPPVWAAVTAQWLGEPALYDFASIGWYDQVDTARAKWMAPLQALVPGSV